MTRDYKVSVLEEALLDLRKAITKAGVKRTPGLYEVVMRLDATVIRRIKERCNVQKVPTR